MRCPQLMTLLPCAVFLLCAPFVCASLPSPNDTSTYTLDASNPSCNTRTLQNIILSCVLTLFACTWTAIHPNIPGMDEGKVTITWRRLCVMAMALMAPELIVTWATRQFFSARTAAKDFNDEFCAPHRQTHDDHRDTSENTTISLSDIRGSSNALRPAVELEGWTMTHGYFAWMGGFMLYVNGKPHSTLTPDELQRFVREGSVDMPIILKADIEDRSKGDGLSKAIALLQLGWFVVQLVARYVQNIPTTLIEIDTLAIAALTCVAYGLWWKKPKNVGRPFAVHWKATASPSRLTYIDKPHRYLHSSRFANTFHSIMGYEVIISSQAAQSRRVPSLGGYASGESHAGITLLIGCASGIMFAGIHCLGWNDASPALIIYWRISGVVMSCMPVIFLITMGCGLSSSDNIRGMVAAVGVCNVIVCFLVRVFVIMLTIWSTVSPPAGVYDTVAWTEFIPHL